MKLKNNTKIVSLIRQSPSFARLSVQWDFLVKFLLKSVAVYTGRLSPPPNFPPPRSPTQSAPGTPPGDANDWKNLKLNWKNSQPYLKVLLFIRRLWNATFEKTDGSEKYLT